MAHLTDLKRAYLLGIRNGFRLARADTLAELEDLFAEMEPSMDVKLRDVRAEFARQCALDSAEMAALNLKKWPN